MSNLEHAKEVQLEVFKLIAEGTDIAGEEGRKTMNRLIGAIRRLAPDEIQEFQKWKAADRAGQ